ncbi:feather beta keratin-like [Melanerpes formicivorus]|uniref:feather beta keratin-like n=2 Tax=Melanerpes formicivorus TaxID=211600 RepID=UPI00358E4F90
MTSLLTPHLCWAGLTSAASPASIKPAQRLSPSQLPPDAFSCALLPPPGPLHPTAMACYDRCRPCGPTPLANSCNEPCVRQCQDSRVFIQPSPVLVTLPGPILTSFPQSTAVGSSSGAALGTELNAQGVPISSGAFGYGYGLAGLADGCGAARGCFPC